MAQKPDGSSAKTEQVAFTRPAAERIARVVRTVESGDRDSAGLSFGRAAAAANGKVFRVCTFTGSWTKNTSKTVTFMNITSAPNTAVASNVFVTISGSTSTSSKKSCAIARDGTAWYLIAAECS